VMMGDAEMVKYLQLVVGYCLTASMREQVFFFLYGIGSNGKSVFTEICRYLLAEYAHRAGQTLLCSLPGQAKDPKNDLAELPGIRLLFAPEVPERAQIHENVIKDITGGEQLRGEAKYKDGFVFPPQCKLLICGNHKPSVDGTDDGIWRRVRLIPFLAKFEGANRDKGLRKKLKSELPGILNWAIKGAQLWLENGLPVPTKVKEAVEDYRKSEDVLGEFIDSCLESSDRASVLKSDVFSRYLVWCSEVGMRYNLNAHMLGRILKNRGFSDRSLKNHRSNYWRGWTIKIIRKTDTDDEDVTNQLVQ